MKNIFVLLLICWASIGQLYSQGIYHYINSVEIIPANPTTKNAIKIVTITTTTSIGVKLFINFTKQADTFKIEGCFSPGLLTATKTYYDTINIGSLNPGTYYVNYVAHVSFSDSSCIVYESKSKATSFQVTEANGIENVKYANNHFSIYPNPTTNFLTIKQNETPANFQLELIDCLGQVCFRTSFAKETTIDTTAFVKGVYIISITSENNRFFHKVIKQ